MDDVLELRDPQGICHPLSSFNYLVSVLHYANLLPHLCKMLIYCHIYVRGAYLEYNVY